MDNRRRLVSQEMTSHDKAPLIWQVFLFEIHNLRSHLKKFVRSFKEIFWYIKGFSDNKNLLKEKIL